MKILMMVQHEGKEGASWQEEFVVEDTHCLRKAPEGLCPETYAQLVIDYFNGTLKRGETRRELVGAIGK